MPDRRRATAIAAAVIALAGVVAYQNSFGVPLIFDDVPSIRDNPTIRHFGAVFRPPAGMTVDAQPVLNASLALNYAWGGLNVTSYHVVDLLNHTLGGLTLFGIVRRTLLSRHHAVHRANLAQSAGRLGLASPARLSVG